ncbi:MAG: radical SAM protein [Clostridiales bacterium]|nr:radical SAM protein [Clostridiales bacterium]
MSYCFECPVMCGADRENGEVGVCCAGGCSFVARAARHYYEEPPISGTRGSGAIFFTGCNMRCVFCQNHEISRGLPEDTASARPVDAESLCDTMLRLQELGAHNINLVTPTPHVRLIERALPLAKARGLVIPIVCNTNGYERVETLKRLEGLIDIYLPDLKYVSPRLAERYSGRSDYFEFAGPAIKEMHRQVGCLELDGEGMAKRGLIVRHLVLPCAVDETRRVLDFIKAELPLETCISLMSQYTPIPGMKRPLDRRLTKAEYRRAKEYAVSLGFTNVFVQELSSAEKEFTPEFDGYFE